MMDNNATREIFESALATQEPEFGKFFLARLLQLEIQFKDGVCYVSLPAVEYLFNPQGSLHGGVIALAMDVSMGHLIHHVTGKGGSTIEMKVQYLRPCSKGKLHLEGRFVKQGRQIAFMESRAFNDEGKDIGLATATWKMPSND